MDAPLGKGAQVVVIGFRGLEGTRHGEGTLLSIDPTKNEAHYRCNLNKGFHTVRADQVFAADNRPEKIVDRTCQHCHKAESTHDEETDHEFETAAETAKPMKSQRSTKSPKQRSERKPREKKTPVALVDLPQKMTCKQCGKTRKSENFRIAHGRPLSKCRDCERDDARARAKKK